MFELRLLITSKNFATRIRRRSSCWKTLTLGIPPGLEVEHNQKFLQFGFRRWVTSLMHLITKLLFAEIFSYSHTYKKISLFDISNFLPQRPKKITETKNYIMSDNYGFLVLRFELAERTSKTSIRNWKRYALNLKLQEYVANINNDTNIFNIIQKYIQLWFINFITRFVSLVISKLISKYTFDSVAYLSGIC